jgi:hypothetical protein
VQVGRGDVELQGLGHGRQGSPVGALRRHGISRAWAGEKGKTCRWVQEAWNFEGLGGGGKTCRWLQQEAWNFKGMSLGPCRGDSSRMVDECLHLAGKPCRCSLCVKG